MTVFASPRAGARIAAATLPLLLLAACSIWTRTAAPPRASISITAPSSIERPEWLQKAVARMDDQAFGGERLRLKLSYSLSPLGDGARRALPT